MPGQPGAEWSEEEVIIVKAKLLSIFRRGGGSYALHQLHPDETPGPWESGSFDWRRHGSRLPDAPKMLRLGFHDCLR